MFVRGGIKDVLVSNQVRDPAKIDRLARLPKLGSSIIVCVDDVANVEPNCRRLRRSTAASLASSSRSTAAPGAAG